MSQSAALLVLRAHSGIHAGVGQEVGTVDLPIQRERVTNFPVIRGPSLKGALRQMAEERLGKDSLVTLLFGPESNASDHGGALSVGDARLLLFPMRSLAGTFAWLTCPFAVHRLKRDLQDSSLHAKCSLGAVPSVRNGQALVCDGSTVVFESRQGQPVKLIKMLVVENYGLEAQENKEVSSLAAPLALPGLQADEIKKRLALVEDSLFQNLVTFGTEVVTRVHLDDQTKTVKKGQLWTEELLPAESVLVALLVCSDARDEKRSQSSGDLLRCLCDTIQGRFQIGGNETVGYGVCHAEWLSPVSMGGR